jgi:four helix bundle protein
MLSDQLKRASLGLPLQIAEGAGKRTKPDQRRFFDYARGSAMECGAVLDVCLKLTLIDKNLLFKGKGLLERIVSMLTKIAS